MHGAAQSLLVFLLGEEGEPTTAPATANGAGSREVGRGAHGVLFNQTRTRTQPFLPYRERARPTRPRPISEGCNAGDTNGLRVAEWGHQQGLATCQRRINNSSSGSDKNREKYPTILSFVDESTKSLRTTLVPFRVPCQGATTPHSSRRAVPRVALLHFISTLRLFISSFNAAIFSSDEEPLVSQLHVFFGLCGCCKLPSVAPDKQ